MFSIFSSLMMMIAAWLILSAASDNSLFLNASRRASKEDFNLFLSPISVGQEGMTAIFFHLDTHNEKEINSAFGNTKAAKEVVVNFLTEIRSGKHPEKAGEFLADTVMAHQITSENAVTVFRTPTNYAAHVQEFLAMFGDFNFEVTELIAEGEKVYVRWIQKGKHLAEIDGYKATNLPLIEYTSAVYLVHQGKIVEYWLQSDRFGFEEQLKRNALIIEGRKKQRR